MVIQMLETDAGRARATDGGPGRRAATTPRATARPFSAPSWPTAALTALLAGYMTAKVAGERTKYSTMAAFVHRRVELAWRFWRAMRRLPPGLVARGGARHRPGDAGRRVDPRGRAESGTGGGRAASPSRRSA